MTELTEAIRNYLPSDDREAADKVAFLQFLEAFGETSYDRENLVGHVTVTAWVSNARRDKVLMCFHNLYRVWVVAGRLCLTACFLILPFLMSSLLCPVAHDLAMYS